MHRRFPLPRPTVAGRKRVSISLPSTYFSVHISLGGAPSYMLPGRGSSALAEDVTGLNKTGSKEAAYQIDLPAGLT